MAGAAPSEEQKKHMARMKSYFDILDAERAISHDDFGTLKRLIEVEGVNVNTVIDRLIGYTLLHKSVHNPEMVQYLLSKGANVNARSFTGMTPLHVAVSDSSGTNPKSLLLLLDAGADVHATNIEGRTAIELANGIAFPILSRYLDEAPKGKHLAAFRTGLTKGTKNDPALSTGLSNMPSGLVEHIGSFLSGKTGTLNAQRTSMRRNAGFGELNATAAGGAGGAGAAAANKGRARRRVRRHTRKRRN